MSFDYERWKEEQFSRMRQEAASGVAFPASVTWAGVIWAATGVFTLVVVAVLSWRTGTLRSPGAALGGLLFLYGGVRAASGAAPGTLRSGIGSIVLGCLWVGAGLVITNLGLGPAGLQLLISGGMGGALILAGFLAVIGRSDYHKWREASAGGGSRARQIME
jgi:hypothetical protein